MKHISETVSTLGLALGRYGDAPFGIRLADRLMHLHVVGQTGTGKSTLLANLALQDAARGFGFCLIDPHGDLADTLAAHLGDRAHLWAPADPDNPYGYNPLTAVPATYHPLVAAGLIDAFKKQWADAWGVRMEHLLRHALLTLLAQPRADLRDLVPLFIDKSAQAHMLSHVTDPQVRSFWTAEFPKMNYKTAFDGVAPIANKLGAFLAHPNVRRALCEPARPLRFRKIMDEGELLIVNLSKGRLGADVTNVLGGLIVASIVNAALSRQTLPEPQRRPFMLHVDEFHAFTTTSIADILPETRKYGLGLTLVHQHIAQVETGVLEAILGNVGSLMVFRVGANDAPVFVRQLERVTTSDLINLPNHRAYVRVMVKGQRTPAFSVATVPPPQKTASP
ncbi:type IV secretory system conjugative DNA transfer family protein [Marimonas sp. MJW-29]|uniref:Type IV secretory system conjugative DNA transfer family protein n=1 Tax=Sulfitobacter sediminis TaxID=3234186 RepID=A0ABV3RR44_9RHOB